MTRIFIAARSAVVRAGLEALVARRPSLAVASTAADADLVLAEPGASWEEPHAAASLPVVMLGEMPPDALRIGTARAVLPPDASEEQIGAALDAAAAGLIVIHPGAVDAWLDAEAGAQPAPASHTLEALTPREVEVLRLVAQGEGNKMIAYRLGISEHTVKFHIASIFTRLNASSRTEAVTLGIRRGLIAI
ncbi:MAG: response regulator transcription factor [Bryobacteraceae bacterium]